MKSQKLKRVFNFKNFAFVVLAIGIALWGILAWGYYKKSQLLPVGGSSDTLMRTQAINEAIKKGEKTYQFESQSGPPMMQESQATLDQAKPDKEIENK